MNPGGFDDLPPPGPPDDLPPPGPPDDLPPPGPPDDLPPPGPPDDLPPPGDFPPDEMISAEQLEFFQQQTGADGATADQWVSRYPEDDPRVPPERAVEMYLTSQQSARPTTIPPPNDEPPPGTWPGQQTLEQRQLAIDRLASDVAAKRSQREQARGTPHEARLAAELQELEDALADAQHQMLAALDEQEDHLQTSAAGGMAVTLSKQAQTRQMFESFSEGKDHMNRDDVVQSINHLGFDCDDDYCTQLLQAFAYGAPVMDIDSFARMWAHLAPDYVPETPPPAPTPGQSDGAGQQTPQPEPEPEPSGTDLHSKQPESQPVEDPVVDEEWKQRRLAELKSEEEERLREEARKHARTVQHKEDDLAHMLRDEDILRALFSRIDPGSTGRTSRNQWLKFLAADAGVLSVMKLSDLETSELEALFSRWPTSGITFPAFVALLRAQFGRVIGIEYHYHDEVKKVQDLEQKLHKEMLEREGEQREEDQKAKDIERERHRQELIDEMRQQQLAQLAEIKKEVLEKLSKEKDLESQSLLEQQIAEVDTAMMGLESLSEWPERLRKLEQARAERAEELKNRAIAMQGKAVSSEEAALAAAGWFTAQDQTGRIYYYNAMTRATSWETPNVAALPSPPPPPPPPGTARDEDAADGNESADTATESMTPATTSVAVTRVADETAALGSDGLTQGAKESSPRELLGEIQQVGAMRSASAASEQGQSGQLAVYQSQPGDHNRPEGSLGHAVDGIEPQNSPTSRVQVMLAQSLAGQSQDMTGAGKRESIADRSRRLREARQAEAAASTTSGNAGALTDAPASRWATGGSSVSTGGTRSSTSRLLGSGVRNSGGTPGSSLGDARNSGGSSRVQAPAVGSTMGLLAARRAQREAEKSSSTRVAGVAAPQPGTVLSAQPVATSPSSDLRASWQQTPRGVGRSRRELASSDAVSAPTSTLAPAATLAAANSIADSTNSDRNSPLISTADEAEPPPWAATRRVVTGGKLQGAPTEAAPPWASKRSTNGSSVHSKNRPSGAGVSSISSGTGARSQTRRTTPSGSSSSTLPWKRT